MAIVVTMKAEALQALVDKSVGGTALFQPKFVAFYDSTAITPIRFMAPANAISSLAAAKTIRAIATGTCPAAVETPIVGAYIVGDVGTYHLDSLADAQALCNDGVFSGTLAAFLHYVIATITGLNITVTALDDVKCNPCDIVFS